MTRIELLDNVAHASLRLRPEGDAGEWVLRQMAPVVPGEFGRASHSQPIFLVKNVQTGQFEFAILLGIDANENLFVDENGRWIDAYIPLHARRAPFGVATKAGGQQAHQLLSIDLDSPRLSEVEGDPLFLPHGGHAPAVEHASEILSRLLEGADQARDFADLLLRYDLVESLEVKPTLADGRSVSLEALYTINEQALRAVADDVAGELNRNGAMRLAYSLVFSLLQFEGLVSRKNARLPPA